MAGLTDYAETRVLQELVNEGTPVWPTSLYVKMHIGDPGEDALFSAASETDRKLLAWDAVSGGSVSASGTPVASWTSLSAAETWTHFSLWDSLTGGNPWVVGQLATSMVVANGGNAQLDSLSMAAD